MPKVGRNAKKSQYGIDESELIELVKCNPSLYDPNVQINEEKLIEDLWEEISDKLNAPVDMVKKKWLNIKNSYARRKSLRSDNNLNFLPASSLDLSHDNSCASSNCSSPKEDGKRSMRSVSQLSTASETERASSTVARYKRMDSRSRSRASTPSQNDAASIVEVQSIEPHRPRISTVEDVIQAPLSESLFLPSKEALQNDVSKSTRRLSVKANGKAEAKKQNVTDSTRAFFESMAMTVSTFPQHIQATLKVRICNLIGDAEYGLTIPKPC